MAGQAAGILFAAAGVVLLVTLLAHLWDRKAALLFGVWV